MQRFCVAFLLLVASSVSWAQDEFLEEIVVTAALSGGDGYYGMPAVTITKQGDFLVQSIRLINDSRSPGLRKQEIISTIENLLRRAKSMHGMALSYGTGFLEPIDLDENTLQLLADRERTDTSYIDIYAKISFDPNRDSKKQVEELREFVDSTKVAGRTEIIPRGDIGLSIVGPEQYRYEIIEKIGTENAKILESMKANCDVAIGGLEGRVEWERTSLSELTLYIPYGLEVSNCTK